MNKLYISFPPDLTGSIIVNFELVASDDVTAAQLNEAYQDLVVFLERGLLRLVNWEAIS